MAGRDYRDQLRRQLPRETTSLETIIRETRPPPARLTFLLVQCCDGFTLMSGYQFLSPATLFKIKERRVSLQLWVYKPSG